MIQYVEALADDAMSNMFGILFPEGIPGGGNAELLRLRMDQAFDEPERAVGKYDINFEGIRIPKTGSEETTKEFSLQFRIDGNYNVHRAIKNWWNLVLNPDTGAMGLESETRCSMIINHYGPPNKTIKYSKRFNGVKITNYKPSSHDPNDAATPSRVECQFIYASVDDLL